jgi:hypothetical protein
MSKKFSRTLPRLQKEIRQVRQQLLSIDLVCPGTLLRRMKVCGKPNCRCARDPKARHGPYYEWSRLKDGRLLHTVVPASQAREIARAIRNHRAVLDLLAVWSEKSAEAIQAATEAK